MHFFRETVTRKAFWSCFKWSRQATDGHCQAACSCSNIYSQCYQCICGLGTSTWSFKIWDNSRVPILFYLIKHYYLRFWLIFQFFSPSCSFLLSSPDFRLHACDFFKLVSSRYTISYWTDQTIVCGNIYKVC